MIKYMSGRYSSKDKKSQRQRKNSHWLSRQKYQVKFKRKNKNEPTFTHLLHNSGTMNITFFHENQ